MDITAKITGVEYKVLNTKSLTQISFEEFDINSCPSCCCISYDDNRFSLSKWVSPKRTRSYPFERVYNTLGFNKRITIIPIIKDEGIRGDRDFLQWDTVSLMSLLDVYVIFTYYIDAEKHKTRDNKVTNQKYDNSYVKAKILEINDYHSSALHWNLKEVKESIPFILEKMKKAFQQMSEQYGVEFHNYNGIEVYRRHFTKGVNGFMNSSRHRAKLAQNRERLTTQPKELLITQTKANITIRNYLGGLYYFTTDEIAIKNDKIFLIESKHTKRSKLPSIADIKDGLLKMILYCNLENVEVNKKSLVPIPVLKLSSENIIGEMSTKSDSNTIKDFMVNNRFNKFQKETIIDVFKEANVNQFIVIIKYEK